MKIALYYPWLYLTSGAERTIVEMCRRSRHEITVFTNRYEPESTFTELREMDVRVLRTVPVERSMGAVAVAAARILKQRVDLSGYDALLVVCEGLGDLMTLRHRSIPAFSLCLTPLRIVFDPHYRARYLENRGILSRLAIEVGSAAFWLLDRLAWSRYQRIFAISEEVRNRAIRGRLAGPDRLTVLHPGVDLDRFRPSARRERVFFVPGRIMWTKNVELAIEAFQRFRERVPEPDTWRLHVAGIVDQKSEPYLEELRALAGDDPAIQFLVHPTDEEMVEQYQSCFATLFTAFNEDWGLVVIEAMASGKPVVATDRGGPREIVCDGTDGLLVEPDAGAFAEAMLRLAEDEDWYRAIAEAAPASADRFGWGPFVERLDRALEGELAVEARRSPYLEEEPA